MRCCPRPVWPLLLPPLLIKTADFEAALQGTPYRGAVLKDVLECYFDTTIQTKREVRDQIDACILRVTNEATAAVQSRLCRGGWMSCPIGAEKDTG
ncbi:MAG: TIGR02679 domain-containing protein [Dysosmobacter welbionis]